VRADARPPGLTPRRLYRLQLALGAAGLAGCALVLAVGVGSVHVQPAGAHRVDVAGVRFTYPAINLAAGAVLALGVLGAAVLIVTLGAAWRQVRAHRRVVRALPVTGRLSDDPAVCVIDAPAPMAFCAGWLRPRIYVSSGALARLSASELRAVLAHEQHHRVRRDPLRLAVSRVLCQALFFLPVLRPLHDRYGDVAELTADAAALEATDGATGPLASAMLVFAATGSGGVVGLSPDRVDSLLGRPSAWRLPWILLVAGLMTIAAGLALAWRASGTASVDATFKLPIVSSQPCLLVLALMPIVACLAGVLSRSAALRPGSRAPVAG
jgi:hypothetical protein